MLPQSWRGSLSEPWVFSCFGGGVCQVPVCFAALEAAMWKAACDNHSGNLHVSTGELGTSQAFDVTLYVSAALGQFCKSPSPAVASW